MNPIEHPETIFLIHNDKVRREMERDRRQPHRRDDSPRPVDRSGPSRRLRLAVSHGLIALAGRIAPPEPADGGLAAGAPNQ